MKKFFNYAFAFMAAVALTATMASCSDDDNSTASTDTTSAEEEYQTTIIETYVNNVVIPTYKSLKEYALALAEDCEDLSTQAKVDQACADWKKARLYWELSEAFLFGAAADYNIDPHIDSWPLDLAQLDAVLEAGDIADRVEAGTAGYGLLGFHAVEYVIFTHGDEDTDNLTNRERDYTTISDEEAEYAAVVAEDMALQCLRLYGAWAGEECLTDDELEMLEEAELDLSINYGERMCYAGLAGNSKYKTRIAAFEEILIGAQDIADEVGNSKIAEPFESHEWSDVESPHSYNSITDFADNIRSVRNAYYGTLTGSVSSNSVSAYVATLDADLDAELREAIEDCIDAIENTSTGMAAYSPFRYYIENPTDASDEVYEAAIEACNNIVDIIDEVVELINN